MTCEAEWDRWTPDEQLIPAVLAGGSHPMREMSIADRAWVVAGLRLKGLTASEIADRLKPCSLRQVRAINAEPLTAVCLLYQREREVFADDRRMTMSELRRMIAELADAEAARDRYKRQLDTQLDLHILGEAGATFVCGHPKNRYNTYVHAATGKRSCRECRTRAVERHRAKAQMISDGIIHLPEG